MDSDSNQESTDKDAETVAIEQEEKAARPIFSAAGVLLLVLLLVAATGTYLVYYSGIDFSDIYKDRTEDEVSVVPGEPLPGAGTTETSREPGIAVKPRPGTGDETMAEAADEMEDIIVKAGNMAVQLAESATMTPQLQNLQQQVQQLQDELDNIPATINLFWALSEVEYLLTTASYELSVDGDVETALYFLASADTRLSDMHIYELQEVREHIADATRELRNTRTYSTLEIMEMLDRLKMLVFVETAPATATGDMPGGDNMEAEVEADTSSSFWSVLWNDFKSLVKISKLEEGDPGGVVTPGKAAATEQVLLWQWYELRGAVLQKDDVVFHKLLAEFRQTLQPGAELVPGVAEELSRLEKARLQQAIESSSLISAIETLRAYQRGNQ